jgi:hypothetical protein
MKIPEEVLDAVMQDVDRFRKEYPEAQVRLMRAHEGQPYLAFDSFSDLWDCGWSLVGHYLWERFGIALVADGLTLSLQYRPSAEPNDVETPLMRLVRFLWAEEERSGPKVMGHIEPLNEIGFGSPNEAQGAAELVRGLSGVKTVTVEGTAIKLRFDESED